MERSGAVEVGLVERGAVVDEQAQQGDVTGDGGRVQRRPAVVAGRRVDVGRVAEQ